MNAAPGQDGPIARLRPGGADRRRPGRERRLPLRGSAGDENGTREQLAEWHRMTPAARRSAWTDLVDWVVWLHDRYELSIEERLPTCWAEHPGLIEELWALKIWREDIYGTHAPTAAVDPTDAEPAGQSSAQASGQAARYWHAELRQVVHAATTFYAAGCRAGHRTALGLAAADPELRGRWLRADPLTGIPASLLAAIPASPSRGGGTSEPDDLPDVLSDAVIRDALQRGNAEPLGELVTEFISFDDSWWTPTAAQPTARRGPSASPRADVPTEWRRVTDLVFSAELDNAADRMRIADAVVARRRASRPPPERT